LTKNFLHLCWRNRKLALNRIDPSSIYGQHCRHNIFIFPNDVMNAPSRIISFAFNNKFRSIVILSPCLISFRNTHSSLKSIGPKPSRCIVSPLRPSSFKNSMRQNAPSHNKWNAVNENSDPGPTISTELPYEFFHAANYV
jgi:hypothetical protein